MNNDHGWTPGRRQILRMMSGGTAALFLEGTAQEGLAQQTRSRESQSESATWRAQWIWSEGEPAPKNFYLYCRKTFRIEEEATEAVVHVAADSRYKLYVNGTFVGRGPARCDQRWQYYDTYDLRSRLQPGENVIAAIVHQYGAPSHSYTLGRGGLFLQGEAQERGGRLVRLDTGETWRVLPAPPWDRESPRTCVAVMWMEIYDARKELPGWKLPGYDDRDWLRPALLGTHPVLPWEHLVPRDIPQLPEEERFPVSVLNAGLVESSPPLVHLDVPKILGRPDGQVVYLLAYLRSPIEQRAALALRPTEGMPPMRVRIWLNGDDLGRPSQAPPLGPEPSVTTLELRPGWNELLLKLGRFSPAWQWDLGLGPVSSETFVPVEWHPEPDPASPAGQAWVLGPYGEGGRGPGSGDPFETAYEPEQAPPAGSRRALPPNRGRIADLDLAGSKNIALLMAMERRRPQTTAGLRDVEKLLKLGEGPCWVSTADAEGNPYLTIDFGKEVAGYVRLRLNGVAGGMVDLGYCETLVDGHVDTLRDHWSFADRYIMRDGPQEWELFFWKGFRYLQLTFRECPKPVAIESVSLVFTSYPVEYRGSFECSDPLLTRIWEVGRWTLQLCMHDAYEDCPWREQGQWCGDAQVEQRANFMIFGDVALGAKCLRQIAQGQNEAGALPAEYPADIAVFPTRQSVGPGIPTFMAQWVTMLLDYYSYTGDTELVTELYPALERLMAYLGRFLDSDGLLADVAGFVFLDWTPGLMAAARSGSGKFTGMNCHFYRALLDAAELAQVIGQSGQRRRWLQTAERLKAAINEQLWSAEEGLYAHASRGNQLDSVLAVHDSVLATYSGVASPERVSASFRKLFGGSAPDVVPIGSPYFYYFFLEALRRAGRHQQALEVTREAYGPMLDAGATTWWEHFGGQASLCHAWSCGPNVDLSAYVLGVLPMEPGFQAVRIEPHPSDLTWAKGAVPTPRGDISVEWERLESVFTLNATVPMQAEVELSLPATGLAATRVTGPVQPYKQEFADGRAHYWVRAPGTFRVEAEH